MHRSFWCVYLMAISTVAAHGYLSWPIARQYRCFRDNDFWWPETGENIGDSACRTAYQSVYAKYRNAGESSGVAANAAQYMFQQYHEYAALAGPNYDSLSHIQNNVIPSNLCAAGAANKSKNFGDKSGIDQSMLDWRADILYSDPDKRVEHGGLLVDIHFCPTTAHDPSYFQVFITKPEYDYSHELQWDDLQLLELAGAFGLVPNDGTDDDCSADKLYNIPVVVPYRLDKFILYVRWQRNDVAGEGFYNCADVIFDNVIMITKNKRNCRHCEL
ncbi:GP37 [Trabala vishnou gigantina nucleopolyhedrovirus]|uniref:GP37 n=1 Tax=Trabala vishnou gigantina nucleopolyhedrovirus TaxID=2863583 RepID=UPI002481B2FC|nr:GP37 [Trabala vishnou gigantina nucleopolyhedrovirus]QYC92716.1 GP37 [Trabala vishnou gigantina nucleopolyhedrovirus]